MDPQSSTESQPPTEEQLRMMKTNSVIGEHLSMQKLTLRSEKAANKLNQSNRKAHRGQVREKEMKKLKRQPECTQ